MQSAKTSTMRKLRSPVTFTLCLGNDGKTLHISKKVRARLSLRAAHPSSQYGVRGEDIVHCVTWTSLRRKKASLPPAEWWHCSTWCKVACLEEFNPLPAVLLMYMLLTLFHLAPESEETGCGVSLWLDCQLTSKQDEYQQQAKACRNERTMRCVQINWRTNKYCFPRDRWVGWNVCDTVQLISKLYLLNKSNEYFKQ